MVIYLLSSIFYSKSINRRVRIKIFMCAKTEVLSKADYQKEITFFIVSSIYIIVAAIYIFIVAVDLFSILLLICGAVLSFSNKFPSVQDLYNNVVKEPFFKLSDGARIFIAIVGGFILFI